MLGLSKDDIHHVELQNSRILKDEQAVTAILGTIDNWINPFMDTDDLVSLSTAITPSPKICEDIQRAHKLGCTAYEKFKEDRLESNPPKVKFYDPLPK